MNEPLDIVGVDVDHVGIPRNDGSAGSALYSVPIQLNRQPTAFEAELLVAHWNRPSSFTLRHRPGIAYVSADRIVLNGTTIEEVRDCHAKTLRMVVDAVNGDAARYEQARIQEHAEHGAAEAERTERVRKVSDEIQF